MHHHLNLLQRNPKPNRKKTKSKLSKLLSLLHHQRNKLCIILIVLICISAIYHDVLNINTALSTHIIEQLSQTRIIDRERKEEQTEQNNDLRVLIAITNYRSIHTIIHLQDIIENFHNLCYIIVTPPSPINNNNTNINMMKVSKITIVIYTTLPYPMDILYKLNSLFSSRACNIQIKLKIKSNSHGFNFVDFHRDYFYKHLHDYDLFVYTEDDLDIRAFHIVSYWEETLKLKNVVGEEKFQDYSIGFIRYEENKKSQQRTTFEHRYPVLLPYQELPQYLETKLPHQGMFMATSEQLKLWSQKCEFHNAAPNEVKLKHNRHREFVSSLRLFQKNLPDGFGCNVQQLIPSDSIEEFMIHHMSNVYCCGEHFSNYDPTKDMINDVNDDNKMFYSLLELQKLRYSYYKDNNIEVPMFVDENQKDGIGKLYNGVRMSIVEDEDGSYNEINEKMWNEWMKSMNSYNGYVENGGKLVFTDE